MNVVAGYKVLGPNDESHHGGTGRWTPDEWRVVAGEIAACRNGIHYCTRDQLVRWLGPTIWRFEDGSPDETFDAGDKMVTRKGRVVERLETWNDTTARLFAADCAETVVHLIPERHRDRFAATIEAARGFARGETSDQQLDAAWAAAWVGWVAAASPAEAAAIWAAAWAAARVAWAAAWAAARVAWAAAEAAARAAARAAAWVGWVPAGDAAWDAARDAQTVTLFDYLNLPKAGADDAS